MKLRLRYLTVTLSIAIAAIASFAQAEVTLPSVISDHLVLQQGMAAPIWGWADKGEKVTVSFAGQEKQATADDNGRWQVKLDALEASKEGRTLSISGSNTIELKDVLVGEVWIC